MRRVAWVILGLWVLPLGAAEVYRSIDANGNVVYSDRPDGAVQELIVVNTRAPANPTPIATPRARDDDADNPDGDATPRRERVEPTPAERAERCAVARDRVARYSVAHRLYRTGADGEREYLNDAQIDEARAKAAADVDNWCS